MVDYSKWDKLDFTESDEEEERNYGKKNVQVTTLPDRQGGKVTIGPRGYHIHGEEDDEENLPSFHEVHQTILENERKKASLTDVDEEEEINELKDSKVYGEQIHDYFKQQHTKESQQSRQILNDKNPVVESKQPIQFSKSSSHKIEPSLRTKNGQQGTYQNIPYEWSQTHYEATVYLYLTESTIQEKLKGISLPNYSQLKKRDFSLSYEEETENQFFLKLFYRHRPSIGNETLIPLLQGSLQYEVETTGDRDNPYDDIVEWEVDFSNPSHLQLPAEQITIEIVLKKHRKFTNAIIWWKNVFRGEPEIDLTKITERSKNYAEFMHNFQLANQQFLEKLKENEKMEI